MERKREIVRMRLINESALILLNIFIRLSIFFAQIVFSLFVLSRLIMSVVCFFTKKKYYISICLLLFNLMSESIKIFIWFKKKRRQKTNGKKLSRT